MRGQEKGGREDESLPSSLVPERQGQADRDRRGERETSREGNKPEKNREVKENGDCPHKTLYTNVHCKIIHKSPKVQTIQTPNNG
jgi:hypothetical protein